MPVNLIPSPANTLRNALRMKSQVLYCIQNIKQQLYLSVMAYVTQSLNRFIEIGKLIYEYYTCVAVSKFRPRLAVFYCTCAQYNFDTHTITMDTSFTD